MQEKLNEKWEILNKINKEMDEIYHQFAVKHNMSDTIFCIMYSLYTKEECTQKDICSEWQLPKQTINYAIRDLEKKQYIELKYKDNNKKNKIIIILTEKGKDYSKDIMLKTIEVETRVYEKTNKNDFDKVLKFYQNYAQSLREEFNKIDN